MKILISFFALFMLAACGNSVEDRSQVPTRRHDKSPLSKSETWSILSERPLPLKVRVLINELEFINECTGIGQYVIERTSRNGTIHISSNQTFRDEYFAIDIFDCEGNSKFYSQAYVDQHLIEHPATGAVSIILRLKN